MHVENTLCQLLQTELSNPSCTCLEAASTATCSLLIVMRANLPIHKISSLVVTATFLCAIQNSNDRASATDNKFWYNNMNGLPSNLVVEGDWIHRTQLKVTCYFQKCRTMNATCNNLQDDVACTHMEDT